MNDSTTTKVILISHCALPYNHIGSWTTLYNNYIGGDHKIDSIVCEESLDYFADVEYSVVKRTFTDKIYKRVFDRSKTEYKAALGKLINIHDVFVIQIVDNYGMVKPLHDYLVKRGIRKNAYIQFFYHGFDPYQQVDSSEKFYSLVDEIIVLTESSYQVFKNKIAVLPSHFSVLHNGIDTLKFRVISNNEKLILKKRLGFGEKKVFLWCSQDRPKKGLNMILEAWRQLYSDEKNIILLVIGCDARENDSGVKYLGKIPNSDLASYYQATDCYLFPTLWHEGFGMSLIEALHCRCYCIASALGGIPEVLQYGKLGKLIDNPHFVSEWVAAIEEFLKSDFRYPALPKDLYSTETWNFEMNLIIDTAKQRLSHRI